jgi:tRNA-splicing ligase RtcB
MLSLEEYQESMKGIYSSCISEDTLDESPMAYKDADEIKSLISETVDIELVIKPIYNFKA